MNVEPVRFPHRLDGGLEGGMQEKWHQGFWFDHIGRMELVFIKIGKTLELTVLFRGGNQKFCFEIKFQHPCWCFLGRRMCKAGDIKLGVVNIEVVLKA